MGDQIKKYTPQLYKLFMKIAEPRHVRIVQCIIYILMTVVGGNVLASPPNAFQSVVGNVLVYMFGGFLTSGAVLGMIAVLPGIWWLERAGLIAMATGMLMYVVMATALGASVMGVILALLLALTFLQRWYEIKGSQLAPREE